MTAQRPLSSAFSFSKALPQSFPSQTDQNTESSTVPSSALLAPELLSTDALPAVSRWMRWGGLVIVASVSGAIALAAITPYSVTVKAKAVVRPTGELRQVEALTSGTVVQILVAENQAVQVGQTIARLDDATVQNQRQQLETQLKQAQQQEQQITAQIHQVEQRLQAERDRSSRIIRANQVQLQQADRDRQAQTITASSTVDEALAELRSKQAQLAAANVNVNRYQSLVSQGLITQATLETAQLEVKQHQEEIAAMQAKLQRLRTSLNPSRAAAQMIEENIAQEQASYQAAIALLNQEKQALIQKQMDSQQQQIQNQQALQQNTQDLKKTEILAPITGTLFQMQLRNPGQAIALGEAIAQVAPHSATPTIKAIVSSSEINDLRVGQSAQLRITACPYTDYGTFKATVQQIAPDATSPGFSNSSTESTISGNGYEITLIPESPNVNSTQSRCQLRPGMTGSAYITTSNKKLLAFLLDLIGNIH